MLNATPNNAKQQYHAYLKKIKEIDNQLEETMTAEDYEVIQNATNTKQIQTRECAFERKIQRASRKTANATRRWVNRQTEV